MNRKKIVIIRNTGTDCCGPMLMVYSKGVPGATKLQLRLWGCDGTERIIPMLEDGPLCDVLERTAGPRASLHLGQGTSSAVAPLGGITGWPFLLHPLGQQD